MCIHHWKIGEANGRTSDGLCVNCGAQRQFSNVTEGFDHGDWSAQGRIAASSAPSLARAKNTDDGPRLSDERP